MRVRLDNEQTDVEISTEEIYSEKFLHLVFKALNALNYTLDDIEREIKEVRKINNMTLKNVEETVFTKLGTASSLFMSNPQKGTEQIMPEAALTALGDEIMEAVRAYGAAQRKDEIQQADTRLKEEFGEDWLEFKDVRLKELNGTTNRN